MLVLFNLFQVLQLLTVLSRYIQALLPRNLSHAFDPEGTIWPASPTVD